MPYHLATPLCGKGRGIGTLPIPHCFVGWVKGLEPSTPGTTIRCSNQLSYTHHISCTRELATYSKKVARQKGLEPLAHCLEGSCSIQLSYWRIGKEVGAGDGNRTRIPSLEGWCPGHCATPACALREIVSFVMIPYVSGLCQEKNKFFPAKSENGRAARGRAP